MHEFLFGNDLSDDDCRNLFMSEETISIGIQSQIDFIILFDLPKHDTDKSYFMYEFEHLSYKNFKNKPELIECRFQRKDKLAAIFWHD